MVWYEKNASPALGLKSLRNRRNSKISLAEIWVVLFLWNESVVKTSQGKYLTYFASTMIQLGPHDLEPVVWLGFDSHHLYNAHLSLSVCAPMVDSNRISSLVFTLLQLLDTEHLITEHLFSLASLYPKDMYCLIAADLWVHWLVACKAQRTVLKQQQKVSSKIHFQLFLLWNFLFNLFPKSTQPLYIFLFFFFHFSFLFLQAQVLQEIIQGNFNTLVLKITASPHRQG